MNYGKARSTTKSISRLSWRSSHKVGKPYPDSPLRKGCFVAVQRKLNGAYFVAVRASRSVINWKLRRRTGWLAQYRYRNEIVSAIKRKLPGCFRLVALQRKLPGIYCW